MLQGVEELGGGLSGGAGVSLNHVPAGDDVAGGELFKDHAGHGTYVQGIDFDQVAGLGHSVLLGFAHGVGPGPQGAARSRNPGTGRFQQACLAFQLGENAAYHGSRNLQLLTAQQYGERNLFPSGETASVKSKPFPLKEKSKSAGVGDGDDGSEIPACSAHRDHSGSASDRKSGAANAEVTASTGHVLACTIKIHPG